MRVLFICRGNVGRSQIAEFIFNSRQDGNEAFSCGTLVDRPGEQISEYAHRHPDHSFVIEAMRELGADISSARRVQLEPSTLAGIDVIISMAERATEPLWLTADPRFQHWDVPDPRGRSLDDVRQARDHIIKLVRGPVLAEALRHPQDAR